VLTERRVARCRRRHNLWIAWVSEQKRKFVKVTSGDEEESITELFGESGKVRRYVDVQLPKWTRVRWIFRQLARGERGGNLSRALWILR
jgi:hypothetical protein